jgi:hypothetical protein
MDTGVESARRKVSEWRLGQTSEQYESSGRGAGLISTGKGDHGGVSYGAYQLSTKEGTLKEYLDQSRYKTEFEGLEPKTPAFDTKWKDLARTDPGFAKDQHDFIGKSHYEAQMARLKESGVDLSGRGRAVQDLVWSTSVQFRNLTPRIVEGGLIEKFGKGYELSRLSDRDIVEAAQDYKIAHNSALFKSSPSWQPGLLRRAHAERDSLVSLASQEALLLTNGVVVSSAAPAGAHVGEHRPSVSNDHARRDLTYGDRGQDVRSYQERLSALGYCGVDGRQLRADSDFGKNTEHAVRNFQRKHGLHVDGVVGDDTREALTKAERAPLLSERTHPDHAFFLEAQSAMKRLPLGTFHGNGEFDRAAAALASEAKRAGLTQIDHVMMSTQGDRLIAVQGNLQDPGRHVISVDKAGAWAQSVEQSTARLDQQTMDHERSAQVQARAEHMEHRNGLVLGIRP